MCVNQGSCFLSFVLKCILFFIRHNIVINYVYKKEVWHCLYCCLHIKGVIHSELKFHPFILLTPMSVLVTLVVSFVDRLSRH